MYPQCMLLGYTLFKGTLRLILFFSSFCFKKFIAQVLRYINSFLFLLPLNRYIYYKVERVKVGVNVISLIELISVTYYCHVP